LKLSGKYRRTIPSVIPLVKMTRHHFFLLCFNFFSHGNSLSIYRGNISVGKIPRKFTNGNIPSVFPFVFINFLVVIHLYWTGPPTFASNGKCMGKCSIKSKNDGGNIISSLHSISTIFVSSLSM